MFNSSSSLGPAFLFLKLLLELVLNPPIRAQKVGTPAFFTRTLGREKPFEWLRFVDLSRTPSGSCFVRPPCSIKKRAKRSEHSGTWGRLSSKTGTRHQWWAISATKLRVKNRFVALAGLPLLLRHGCFCHVRSSAPRKAPVSSALARPPLRSWRHARRHERARYRRLPPLRRLISRTSRAKHRSRQWRERKVVQKQVWKPVF